MTITAYGTAAQAAWRARGDFGSLKASLGTLQAQLASGKTAQTYAGLGAAAATSLSGHAQVALLDGYGANVADAKLRVQLMSQGVGQIQKLGAALTTSLATSFQRTPIGQTSAAVSAEDGLKQVIDILNSQVGDRYLFSGRTADVQPVAGYGEIIDGDGTRAGLKQLEIAIG